MFRFLSGHLSPDAGYEASCDVSDISNMSCRSRIKDKKFLVTGVVAVLLSMTPQAHAGISIFSKNAQTKQGATLQKKPVAVDHITWQNFTDIKAEYFLNAQVPDSQVSLFFIRDHEAGDADGVQTSAKIGVNELFQTSLQPGGYSQTYTCAGITNISASTATSKTNDLLENALPLTLEGGKHYFYKVTVDEQGVATLKSLPKEQAVKLLEDKLYQNHQISRVLPQCPKVITPSFSATGKKPVAQVTEPEPSKPSLLERIKFELEVYFDDGGKTVKSSSIPEIEQVANFMIQYPKTVAVIEGHTDNVGEASFNKTLSQKRAQVVKDMLTEKYGISETRLETVGYGEEIPIASNDTALGRERNRRVVIVVVQ